MFNMREKKASNEFGMRLRAIRKARGLTQYKLADIMNISQRMIAHYENELTRPPLDKIKEFAQALGVNMEELIGSTDIPQKNIREEISLKLVKRVKVIEKLPVRDQKAIFRLINSLLEKNSIKI
jgi:transcriptional regulator with XRE-family HTH domain